MAAPSSADSLRTEAPDLRAVVWGCALIIIAGLNLRPGIVAVAPVLAEIESDLGVDSVTLGMLTAVPLACFALFSPFVPALANRWPPERLVVIALATLVVASAARLVPSLSVLFLATFFIGIAIAIGNVLMPVIVKTQFPDKLGLATGLYSISLFAGAALAGSLTVPLADVLPGGWRASLASWGVLAAIACITWLPLAHSATLVSTARSGIETIWLLPLAWWVTAYMGLQSFQYFTVAAWLPQILIDAGHSPATSGLVLGISNVVAMAAALGIPILGDRSVGQRAIGVALAAAAALGLATLLLLPAWPVVAAALLGLGQGGAIGLALLLVVRRAGSPVHVAALSSLSQSVGYLLASVGAPLLGAIHAATHSWTIPVIVLIALLGAQAIAVFLAGASRTLARTPRPEPS